MKSTLRFFTHPLPYILVIVFIQVAFPTINTWFVEDFVNTYATGVPTGIQEFAMQMLEGKLIFLLLATMGAIVATFHRSRNPGVWSAWMDTAAYLAITFAILLMLLLRIVIGFSGF